MSNCIWNILCHNLFGRVCVCVCVCLGENQTKKFKGDEAKQIRVKGYKQRQQKEDYKDSPELYVVREQK